MQKIIFAHGAGVFVYSSTYTHLLYYIIYCTNETLLEILYCIYEAGDAVSSIKYISNFFALKIKRKYKRKIVCFERRVNRIIEKKVYIF